MLPKTKRQALARLAGYIWADGHQAKDGSWRFEVKSPAIAKHFIACAEMLGFTPTIVEDAPNAGKGKLPTTIYSLPKEFWNGDVPAVTGNIWRTRQFLASVIESEGSVDGKVLDDPYLERVEIAEKLWANVGMTVRRKTNVTSTFYSLWLPEEYWPELQRFPLVVYGRCPTAKALVV